MVQLLIQRGKSGQSDSRTDNNYWYTWGRPEMSGELFQKIQDTIRELVPDAKSVRIELRHGRIDLKIPRVVVQEPPKPMTETTRRNHGPDFRSVVWDGEVYGFSPGQAAVVEKLWQAMEGGYWDLAKETLIDSEADLGDLFRKHPAWGTMIVPGKSKGTYRLSQTGSP